MFLTRFLVVCSFALCVQTAWAQSPTAYWAKDIPKSQDHPLVARPAGATIAGYSSKTFEESKVLVGPIGSVADSWLKAWNSTNTAVLSGKTTNIIYRHPKGEMPVNLYARQRAALVAQGYAPRFECNNMSCAPLSTKGREGSNFMSTIGIWIPGNLPNEFQQLVGTNNNGGFYYGVFRRGANTIALLSYDRDFYALAPYSWYQIIEGTAMETDKIKAPTAAEISSSMKATGKQILYGVFFDTDQAVVKPESKATLDEIASLLKSSPQLRLIVAGHTDNVGEFGYNVGLSNRRAAAVIQKLSADYGIAGGRLVPFGAGMAGPIASNADEAGRSKNRRVELVPR
jgi:OmpA-OmpF porin, OOP family